MRHTSPICGLLFASVVLSSTAFAQSPSGGATPAPMQKPTLAFPHALEAKGTGIKLFSLYDENSPAIRELTTSEILIAHGEKTGWYEVEVPASYPCWVYSRFLDETGVLGMGIVTDDRVNVRAIASSDKNYPIGKISKGEQVRVLDHKGEWTQILAPSSLRAWVRQTAVNALGTPESNTSRIEAARTQAESQWKERLTILAAQREEEKKRAASRESFLKAEEAFAKEKGKAQDANFSQIRSLYQEASTNADKTLAEQIKTRIASIDALESVLKEKVSAQELERRAKEMDEKVKAAKDKAMAEAEERINFTKNDKMIGRYDGVGWLKKSLSLTKGTVFTVEKGGIVVCEIFDPKGRYALADFVGHEIGIKGKTVSALGETKRIEVGKIEVLAGP